MTQDWLLILWAVLCIVIVLGMSYWVTRFLAGKGRFVSGIGRRTDGQIKIVERHMLGRDQSLLVVQACEKYYLLGVTANNISLISEIEWDPAKGPDGEKLTREHKENPAFREAFFHALRQKTRR